MGHLIQKDKEYSIAHAYVYGKVRQEVRSNIVDRKNILKVLRWYIRIPGPHQLEFLDELEKSGFFKRISRDRYEVLRPKKIKQPRDFYGNPLWD